MTAPLLSATAILMIRTLFLWAALPAAVTVAGANAQTVTSADSHARTGNDTSIFAPLLIPPRPSARHLATGAPGPKYWQNRADYDLSATLDTVTGSVRGSMVLRYTNHSPDTLRVMWFHTEQNEYRRPRTGGDSASVYGDVIDRFSEVIDGTPTPVQFEDRHERLMRVTLPKPLAPGETATFQVAWHFIVPPHSFSMGREGSQYQIGQWYPRPNVYDDVTGWPRGGGTFNAEFGDFTLSATVPSNYIVAAGGQLDNAADVLTAANLAHLTQANKSDTTVHIVTAAELKDGSAYRKHDGMVTWKFHGKNMRDMAWSASPDYLWDATSWKGISAQAFYRLPTAETWRDVAEMARMSVQEYSERWFPYPYPQITVAEGPVPGGQEWPTITFVGTFPDQYVTYKIVTHEIGHSWLPMLTGGNGEAHPWMHEGINTFISSTFSEARRYPDNGDQAARADQYIREIEEHIAQGTDFAIDDYWNDLPSEQYGAYDKPAGILQILRRDVMGPALFDKGLRLYIRRWAYKHATPQDFFRTMNDAAGRPLDWFWREWFFEAPGFDQGIDSVSQAAQGSGSATRVRVVYGNHARRHAHPHTDHARRRDDPRLCLSRRVVAREPGTICGDIQLSPAREEDRARSGSAHRGYEPEEQRVAGVVRRIRSLHRRTHCPERSCAVTHCFSRLLSSRSA